MSDLPKYHFCIAHGKYSGASDSPFHFEDDIAAWQEMTKVCGDLVGGICRDLKKGERRDGWTALRMLRERLANVPTWHGAL